MPVALTDALYHDILCPPVPPEGAPFDRRELDSLLDLALAGTTELTRLQQAALAASVERAGA